MNHTRVLLIALLLAVLATSAVFAGGEEEGASGAPASFNATGFPIVDEPITITALAQRRSRDVPLADLTMFRVLSDLTNVSVEWTEIDEGYSERKSLALASGDLPDMFWGSGLNDSDILGNIESFVPLRGLIDQYGPNITRFMEIEPAAGQIAIAPDGEIYGLPTRLPHRPVAYHTVALNQTWLDNLGLDVPTTTEELADVLVAFRENDANGNGDPDDEIPYSSSTWDRRFDWLRASFGLNANRANSEFVHFQVDEGQITFLPITDEYRTFVQYMRGLYELGVLDPESFTQNEQQWRSKLRNDGSPDFVVGLAAVFTIESMFGPRGPEEYIRIDPMVGPTGLQLFPDNSLQGVIRNRGSITVLNEHPEATLRWFDVHYEDDWSVQMQYGTLDEQLTLLPDGRYDFLPLEDPEMSWDVAKWMFAPANRAAMGVYRDLEARIIPNPTTAVKIADDTINATFTDPSASFPNVFLDQATTDEKAILWTDIESIINQNFATWIAEGGVEAEWDSYVEELYSAGLERYLEIYQTALDNQ